MITFGIISKQLDNSSNQLLDILSNADKAKEVLASLKQENEKLLKLKKDILKAKSLDNYIKEQEELASAYKASQEEAVREIELARDAAHKAHIKELKELTSSLEKLELKGKELKEREAKIKLVEQHLFKASKEMDEKLLKLDAEFAKALNVKTTYENKLADLQNRLKGL